MEKQAAAGVPGMPAAASARHERAARAGRSDRAWFSAPWRRIYTLNVDDLEAAVARQFVLPRRLRSISAIAGADPPPDPDALDVVHPGGFAGAGARALTFSTLQYASRLCGTDREYERLVADLALRPFVFAGTTLDEVTLWRHLERHRRTDGPPPARPPAFLTRAADPARGHRHPVGARVDRRDRRPAGRALRRIRRRLACRLRHLREEVEHVSKSPGSFSRGVLLGTALMYFFDPTRGRARRARVRDLAHHLRVEERRFLVKAAHDARGRVRGLVERVRHAPRADVGDEILEARVRTQLGRAPNHVGAIAVTVRDHEVWVRGVALMSEANAILKLVGRVPGVRVVHDELERHASADLPALQRSLPSRVAGMWPPSVQLGAVTSGALLATWGLLARRGVTGALLATAGGALALRGGLNVPVRELLQHAAGRRAIEVQKTLMVRAPIDRVFGLWRHVENFPRFMQHVQDVRVDPQDENRSRWTVDGPAGRPIEFESTITRVVHLREIAWRTLPGQRIEHAGIVRFEPVLDGTRVTIRMSYRPPGGVIGHAIAHVLGWDPKARIDDDMIRMKALLEQGRTRAHGGRISMKDILH